MFQRRCGAFGLFDVVDEVHMVRAVEIGVFVVTVRDTVEDQDQEDTTHG